MEPIIKSDTLFLSQKLCLDNDEILIQIIRSFSYTILGNFCTLNKRWGLMLNQYFNQKRVQLYRTAVFSPMDWNIQFAKNMIDEEEGLIAFKALPPNIDEIPCPVHHPKKMVETHVFTYCPKGLTLKSYGILLKNKLKNEKGFYYIWDEIINNIGDKSFVNYGWKAMIKEEIPKSRGETFDSQKKIVAALNKTAIKVFRIPTVLEAIVCISTVFFKSGNKIFPHFTRCQEDIEGCQLVVMDDTLGLRVVSHDGHYFHGICIASIREF